MITHSRNAIEVYRKLSTNKHYKVLMVFTKNAYALKTLCCIPTIRISELLLRQAHNGTAQSKEYPNVHIVTSSRTQMGSGSC